MVAIKTVTDHDSHELIGRSGLIRIRGILPPGFKYLEDAEQAIIEPVLLFLRKKCCPNGYLVSKSTCATYAEHLYEWFSLLEVANRSWYAATSTDIDAYSAALFNQTSLHTKKKLSARTRKARLRTIVSFYRSCQEDNLIIRAPSIDLRHVPGDEHPFVDVSEIVRAQAAVGRIIVSPSTHPKCISEQHLAAIFAKLGPMASSKQNNYRETCRDRLCAETALHTGMRLDEVASLLTVQILALVPGATPSTPCVLHLTKTKRRRPRDVFLPSSLVTALHEYIDNERAAIVERAKSLKKDYIEPPQLFLNRLDSNKRDFGSKLTPHRIMAFFRTAVESAGVVTLEPIVDLETGKCELRYEAAYSFHCLRHTFAYTCHKMFQKTHPKPWRVVQHLLGHADEVTTRRHYLAGADIEEAAVSDGLVKLFETWQELAHAQA
jgi:integrase